jgi:monothiol glutaredoxin
MPRAILDEAQIHPRIRERIAAHHGDVIEEVRRAIDNHDVVVVGMAQNPHPRRARGLLTTKGISFEYLEYGSYFSEWRRRTAIKMWTGWPTFPMIFVKGTLIGGASDLAALLEAGELEKLLAADR